jgi:hypothetical protein
VDLGSLSTLGASIGEKCDFKNRPQGQCVAYGRDRGEAGESSRPVEGQALGRVVGEEHRETWEAAM